MGEERTARIARKRRRTKPVGIVEHGAEREDAVDVEGIADERQPGRLGDRNGLGPSIVLQVVVLWLRERLLVGGRCHGGGRIGNWLAPGGVLSPGGSVCLGA